MTLILDMNAQTTDSTKLHGRLVNNRKESIVGANIIVKGTPIGTSSGICGDFEIDVPPGGKALIVSWLCPTIEIDLDKVDLKTGNKIIFVLTTLRHKEKDECRTGKMKGEIVKVK